MTAVRMGSIVSPTIGYVAVRGVIFDWGGVLTNPIIDTVSAWLKADRIDRDSYVAAIRPWVEQAYGPVVSSPVVASQVVANTESPVHALERGEISDPQFEAILAGLLVGVDGQPVRADGLLRRMFAATELIPDMLDVVRELRGSGVRTGLLSNSWGVRDGYPTDLLAELFDGVVISADVGMRKPEERIFLLAAGRIGLMPAECAFVDDVEANVVAATALGFAGVHHSGPEATKARLAQLLAP
jgi:putative hydrolase of the HAD superfamily